MKIISRKEAKALGLKRYFTGKPCPAGHVAQRRVSQKCCIKCNNLRFRPEKMRRDNRSHNRRRHLKGKLALRALRELGIEIKI